MMISVVEKSSTVVFYETGSNRCVCQSQRSLTLLTRSRSEEHGEHSGPGLGNAAPSAPSASQDKTLNRATESVKGVIRLLMNTLIRG